MTNSSFQPRGEREAERDGQKHLPVLALIPSLCRRYGPARSNPLARLDSADGSPLPRHAMRPESLVQGVILASQRFWAGAGLRHPAALRHGNGGRHLSPGNDAARAWAEALERGLCAALAAAQGRPLRWNPNRLQLLYYQFRGDPEVVAAEPARSSHLEVAGRDRHRRGPCTTSALSRTTGESPTLGAWGFGLGVLVRRRGSFAVHRSPARSRGSNGSVARRTHLRARTSSMMYVQGVDRVYDLNFNGRDGDERRQLWRRLPAGRAGIFPAQLRALRTFEMLFKLIFNGRGGLQEISRCRGGRDVQSARRI